MPSIRNYIKMPRKLLNLTLSDELSNGKQAISLSEADSVVPLYKNLWSQIGPGKYMRTQPLNNKIEMSEIWIPITVESYRKIQKD